MEKNNNIEVIALLIVIIVILGALCALFATGTISFNNNSTNDNNKVKNYPKENNTQKNDNNNTQSDDNNTNQENTINNLKLEGRYNKEAKDDKSYYKSTVIITNETETSIDFKISTAHGKDSENVNIGNLSGKANKIGDNMYQFEETINGRTNKITFEFSFFKSFQYLTINEIYPDSINPYGGHGVYFAAEYLKT